MKSRFGIVASILLVALGGAAASPDWTLERAEERRREGKLDAALKLTEQELEQRYKDPGPELVELHLAILQQMGRTAEAASFREFVDRYKTGADTFDVGPDFESKNCRSSQPGFDLIRSWGELTSVRVPYSPDSLAATFEIDLEGNIEAIRVARARHPGAAWLAIRKIGTAKLSPTKLASRREADPASFPVSLCVVWSSGSTQALGVSTVIRGFGP